MNEIRRVAVTLLIAALASQAAASGQTRGRAPARQTRAPQTPPRVEAPQMTCPNVLGEGIQTKRMFCDVAIGRDPALGIVIPLPPHTGPVTLRFDLHNRHTYSEELSKSSRGYRRYTASIGVLTKDNTLVSRAVIQSEFRTAKDLVDRVSGGTGSGGVKAVAPTGSESIVITIPAEETSVSILGERLTEERIDATDSFIASGRPVAVISNVMIEYRPGPAPRTPARRQGTAPPGRSGQ
jgi:hypothetical protein